MENRPSRTEASRLKKLMNYDTETIYPILDEAFVCTVSYVKEGEPRAIPAGFVRIGDYLFIHGSVKSHFFMQVEKADSVCITVVIMDGIVLAKSGFNHSFNYRSVVLFGHFKSVLERKTKQDVLYRFTEKYIPGRWDKCRQPDLQELKATSVLKFQVEEMSSKIREGMPNEAEKDKKWPAWSGIVPMKIQMMDAIPDENNAPDSEIPEYIQNL